MDDNDIEILTVSAKKEWGHIKMSGLKSNVGQKRRRSLTPMRPVAIAPKTHFPRGLQNLELSQSLTIKGEPGFITIMPRGNQKLAESDSDKSIGKIDQYEVLESFTAGPQNAKRMKLGTEEVPTQYIILQNQSLETCNTILITDNEDRISKQPKTNSQEYTIMKNTISHNSSTLQQYNVIDKSNAVNRSTLSISPKLNFNRQEQISILQSNNKFNSHQCNVLRKNNSTESSYCSTVTNLPKLTNESKPAISKNTISNHTIASFDTLSSLKSRAQKPIVIMQQLLSPPSRNSSVKSKLVALPGLNKILPLNAQSTITETKTLPELSPLKANEILYDSKTISPAHTTKINNYEQETDFLLKKEFPVISCSQVDSVLKAIDMQSLNRGIVLNEVTNHTKKHVVDKDTNDGCSLPCTEGAAKFSLTENVSCTTDIINDTSTKLQTNRAVKRFQSEKRMQNYSKTVEQLVDTLQCYKCKECPYMSLNEKHVLEHIEREHINVSVNKEKPVLKCPGCSNTFHFDASLLSHIVHDHQVQEKEARLMVQQLSPMEGLSAETNSPKPISPIRITKTQNEQIFITQTQGALLGEDEQAQAVLQSTSAPIAQVEIVETSPQASDTTVEIENEELQYIQNINNMPVVIGNNLDTVDMQNVSFLNDDKIIVTKSDVHQNEQVKLLELKNIECSENLNLLELKSAERNFEFVNFKNESHHEGEGYLQEDDIIEKGLSDAGMEFVSLSVTRLAQEDMRLNNNVVKVKKKGRPKGSKSFFPKPQPLSLKQLGYKCELEDCGVRMLVQENIVYHQKCHIPITTSPPINYQCPECVEFKSNNWNNLAGHLWRSHIIDMELHSCDLCSYKTPSLSNLANQHRGIHGDDRPFLCDNCGKGFKTTKQLRNHRALHRAKAKEPLKCGKCKRDFTNTRLLKLHKDTVHKESKPFTCNVCSYSASTRSALKLHLRRHTGEKPFTCEQCSYSTGDHNSLRRHKLRHLGLKPYSCPHCSYASIQSSTYKVHLKNKHPGLDHDLMFSCQYCSYKSIKKENLLTHMAKHENVLSNNFPAGSRPSITVE